MNGKIMWSERFINSNSYRMHSYTNTYEVWVPVHFMAEPTEEMIVRLETVARKAFETNPAWRVPSQGGPCLRWISGRDFDRIEVTRYQGRKDGHIEAAHVVFIETESICD